MSTMYSRSMVMMEQAKAALSRISEDEAFLDIACFDTQQAIEFLLKVVLFESGVRYDRTHNIRYLYDLAKASGFSFERADELDSEGLKETVRKVQELIYSTISTGRLPGTKCILTIFENED